MSGSLTLPAPLRRDALRSFGRDLNVAIIGASGGIGGAMVAALSALPTVSNVFALSRSALTRTGKNVHPVAIDIANEASVAAAAQSVETRAGKLQVVFVATGILHGENGLQPEKSWRALNADTMEHVFKVNTIGPALAAKHFLPLLARGEKSVFAALSARVGSVEDNRLGGWHAYRTSKAALNMMIKTLSIELARRNPDALCVALHPGTVDTALSRPFQRNVGTDSLFSAPQAANQLLAVIDGLSPPDSGGLYAWDGSSIPF